MAAASVTTVLQLSHMSLLAAPAAAAAAAAVGAPVASWRTAERSVRSAAGAVELQKAGDGAGRGRRGGSCKQDRRLLL